MKIHAQVHVKVNAIHVQEHVVAVPLNAQEAVALHAWVPVVLVVQATVQVHVRLIAYHAVVVHHVVPHV